MTFAFVPEYIVAWHRALLLALRVDFFRPGLREMNDWRDFLAVMDPLKETNGGEFTKDDLARVVALMREQNKRGGNWSLRFSKIMANPEPIRDLALELRAKKRQRPRPEIVRGFRTTGAITIATETDPAAEAEARPVSEEVSRFMEQYNARKARNGKASE